MAGLEAGGSGFVAAGTTTLGGVAAALGLVTGAGCG